MSFYYCTECRGMRAEPSDADRFRCKVCGESMTKVKQ